MPSPSAVPCPWCGAAPGSLFIMNVMVLKPLGSFSLAGVGMKAPGTWRPSLVCRVCYQRLTGTWADERHPEFDRNAEPEPYDPAALPDMEQHALPEK